MSNRLKQTDSLERIAKISQAVQSQDIVSDRNGHMDSRISETDSYVSDDTDTASVRRSMLDKCADVEETIASLWPKWLSRLGHSSKSTEFTLCSATCGFSKCYFMSITRRG